MRVVGEYAARSEVSGNVGVGEQRVDEQMVEALKVAVQPHDLKAANGRLDSIKEMISSLSSDEAKDIYNRVATCNRKDELSELFNSRFYRNTNEKSQRTVDKTILRFSCSRNSHQQADLIGDGERP
jgi:hypothetical protein